MVLSLKVNKTVMLVFYSESKDQCYSPRLSPEGFRLRSPIVPTEDARPVVRRELGRPRHQVDRYGSRKYLLFV